jgi:signal transduction histidine kinase/ActR/RegA family two-component response regulator
MNTQRFTRPYMWASLVAGTAVCLYSVMRLPLERLDVRFLLLAVITISISSRLTVQIPRISGHISVSDTFIFLTMLLYGGEAAVLLAAAEALCSSLRFSQKAIPISSLSILFNSAMMACSTFLTVLVLRFCFGNIPDVPRGSFSATFFIAICLMALVQYIANSVFAAVHTSFKTNQPILRTWTQYYLWASITYLAGASAAGITAKAIDEVGFYAVVVVTPIIAIVFFTYRTYLKNIEAMAAAAKAEQAERHVEELNHYIAEQERIREQFSQLEKLSALGELASGVAHDFNNTLAGILGRAQLLLRSNDQETVRSGLKIIIRTAEDGAKTIKRIQDFARQRRDHDFAPIAVDQLLFDVSEITRPRWKDCAEADNVHISLELQIRSRALVMGDASELREVLVNMVFNAVDAMPAGGTLTLSAAEADGCVEISVRDTGVGMKSETSARVFDPFFTTKGKAGMGLGLAVSYGIIRRHEGNIEVESEVGHGTAFRIRLPIARGAVKGVTGELVMPLVGLPAPSNRTRILVIDDEDYVRELLRDILESEGYEVVLADCGREALKLFDAESFDAVFTDVGLPGMSGWEVARAIRERNKRLPLGVITGWGEAVGSNEQREAQIDWVVAKPFTVDRILEIAREVSLRRDNGFEKKMAFIVAA